jgi:hypothetical protein
VTNRPVNGSQLWIAEDWDRMTHKFDTDRRTGKAVFYEPPDDREYHRKVENLKAVAGAQTLRAPAVIKSKQLR